MTFQPTDVAVVLGTRPEIIKLASVIRALGDRARVVHTGQHWDDAMAGRFFEDLGIGQPDVRLTGMSGVGRAEQISAGIAELAAHFAAHPVAAVVVQGDTNSTSAGAQAANYLGVPVVHVEAGLRSFDRGMPEEINRLVVGAIADMHCAATEQAVANLLDENLPAERIALTGNTVVEATREAIARAESAERFAVEPGAKILATIHRPENTDDPAALERVLEALIESRSNVVLAAHPRTVAAAERFGLTEMMHLLDVRTGLGHADFLALAQQADLLVSDSGGVQEETTVLQKPLLVVRRSTERPESIAAGFARLVPPSEDLLAAIRSALGQSWAHLRETPSPYGDGFAGWKIAQIAIRLGDARVE
ncbi:non-hydrolyzing UDP-N-acetylglucosamine 2-epimerase [Leucobacter iarius]|uniref:UDP-N-acetylglucosamine 2-epimerase (Non-hydrolyzing) n=1 Tax=Leucobacter iarius TaxID=333963 RepID=A0ABP4XD22_9MICO